MKRVIFIFIVICSMTVFAGNGSATIFQITNNDFNDAYPSLSDGTIAWRGDDGYSTNSVYFWGGGDSIQQLTQNGRYRSITVDSGNVYWNKYISHTSIPDSYFWDGQNVTHLFSGQFNSVDNGTVLQASTDGNLTFTNNGTVQTIHINDYASDYTLVGELCQSVLDNDTLAWLEIGGPNEGIYYWNGTSTVKISDDNTNSHLYLHNGQLAWNSGGGVYFWDGTSTSLISTNVLFNETPIFDGTISWMGNSSSDGREIYFWNGSSIETISNNPNVDDAPSLYNNTIAWMGSDGNDLEIFYWDGGSLDERIVLDLDIHAFNDGNNGSSTPEPSTILLFGLGLLGFAGVSRKKTA